MAAGIRLTQEEWIQRARAVHGDTYDYSKVEYKNTTTKIVIVCSQHGEFSQLPTNHVERRQGCPTCGRLSCDSSRRTTLSEFIAEANKIHKNRYDYSEVAYKNRHTKVKIVCSVHGEFLQTPSDHLHAEHGCPFCNVSHGEKEIAEYLLKEGIRFEQQKRFPECRNKRSLPFDFYLPDLNTLIEYQGIHHYQACHYWRGEEGFKQTQLRDNIKRAFCKEKGIRLLEIASLKQLAKVFEA